MIRRKAHGCAPLEHILAVCHIPPHSLGQESVDQGHSKCCDYFLEIRRGLLARRPQAKKKHG